VLLRRTGEFVVVQDGGAKPSAITLTFLEAPFKKVKI